MSTHNPEFEPEGRETFPIGSPLDPERILIQGASPEHPKSWGVTLDGHKLLNWPLQTVTLSVAAVQNLVGVKNAESRLVELATANANDEVIAARRKRLSGLLAFLTAITADVKRDRMRLIRTKEKTPRLERYAIGRDELPSDGRFSVGKFGDLVQVVFWVALLVTGCLAEVIVGRFNVERGKLEDMTAMTAWLIAFLPFTGTFGSLAWLDPGDADRDRSFYKWLTRAAVCVVPVGMLLFAAKLDALLNTDHSQANPSDGPSYTSVICSMQISFALAIYLATLKLGDAWYRFLGYGMRKTREYLETCIDLATADEALCSLAELFSRIQGAIDAIDARTANAIAQYKSCFEGCVKAAEKRRRIADDKATAAAAKARLESENDDDGPAAVAA